MEVTMGKCRPVRGTIRAPPSKSYTHRALILAGLADGPSCITGQLDADDTRMTARALMSLGVRIDWSQDTIMVHGRGNHLTSPASAIDTGDSGTTMRLMTAVSLLADQPVILTGSSRMKERPIGTLVNALNQSGAEITFLENEGFPPIRISGHLTGGVITIDGSISSQFISSLLIASPYASNDTEIRITGNPVSTPYICLTLRMMEVFGVGVRNDSDTRFLISAGQHYQPVSYRVEGDYSSVSYWLALAAVTGGSIRVTGLNQDSLQGDRRILDILVAMGCHADWDGEDLLFSGGNLTGIEVSMDDCPDIIQTISIVAACATGPSTIRGIHHLRSKESDRVEAIRKGLSDLGGEVMVSQDWLTVQPRPLHGGVIHARNDHRTAMSFAILGCAIGGVTILDAGCVSKSYPEFWKELNKIWQTAESC